MTAPLSAQSAIEILESEWHTGDSVQALIVLRRVVKDYASLRAENERLREQHKTDEGVNLRLCEMHTNQQKELHNLGKAYKKAEAEVKHRCDQRDAALESCSLVSAELERLKVQHHLVSNLLSGEMEELKRVKAELARQAPLVNALLRIANEAFPLEVTEKCMRSVARAALALREGAKK